jgi:uncharacterized protein (TIGR00299 family) protein
VSRAAYFDCFSGISGDMVLGALLACGAEPAVLDGVVAALGLEEEVSIEVRREERGHLAGTRVVVTAGDGSVRALPELLRLVREAPGLAERVRARSLAALDLLGQAESRVHGLPAAEIHLHELGGADTLVDLVGSFSLLESLGVEEVYCSPLPAERGWTGELPLPAPAALQVLAGSGAVLEPVEERVELVTPTGAAIVAVVARFERPILKPARIGYGIGGRDRPGNALRVWLGELVASEPASDRVAVLETNLDDMAPNLLAAAVEDLLAAGALDVSVAPALMKKGRAGQLVSVLAPPELADELARLLLRSSPTLGVRITEARRVLAERQVLEVDTELGRGRVKVKYLEGEPVEWAPEYEDARRLAQASGRELREVMRLLSEAARAR